MASVIARGDDLLGKRFRLKRRKDYQSVYARRDSVAAGTLVLYIRDNDNTGSPRVGFSVSKKIGGAVVRNRCRRLLSEAVRVRLSELRTGRDYVFVGRQALARADFAAVKRDVERTLRKKGCLPAPESGVNI